MNVAIVGLGNMGKKYKKILQEISGVEICAMIDPILEQDNKHYNNVEDAIEKEHIDFAIISTPTITHKNIALKFLKNKIHTFIEKPITSSVDDAYEISFYAKKHNCKVAVGHVERFNPAIIALKDDLKEQKILTCNIKRMSPYPKTINDVGVKLDLGVHDIDLVRYITEKEVLSFNSVCSTSKGNNEDTAMFFFGLSDSCCASITNSWMLPYRERKIEILTDEFYYVSDLINHTVVKYSRLDNNSFITKNLFINKNNALLEQINSFINLIKRNKQEKLASINDAIIAIKYALI